LRLLEGVVLEGVFFGEILWLLGVILEGVVGVSLNALDLDLTSTGIWEGVFGATKLSPGAWYNTIAFSVLVSFNLRFRMPVVIEGLWDSLGLDGGFILEELAWCSGELLHSRSSIHSLLMAVLTETSLIFPVDREDEKEDGMGGSGFIIPLRFPLDGISSSSESWFSIAVAGRDFGRAVFGLVVVDWLKAIEVCGRFP
jgi:hypothetical protein